jgi:hypothetical protein
MARLISHLEHGRGQDPRAADDDVLWIYVRLGGFEGSRRERRERERGNDHGDRV